MGIVDKETLRLSGETEVKECGKYRFEYELGDIEVTLAGETRRLPCKVSNGTIYVSGISGRYRTGTQAWPASVLVNDDRGEFIHFGRDERSGRCVKSMLFFDGER